LKELDKKEKHDLKAKEKTEKGKRKKIVEVQDPTIDSAVVDEVFQQMSDPHQGTKRDTSHLSLTEEPIVMDAIVDATSIPQGGVIYGQGETSYHFRVYISFKFLLHKSLYI
jgi:hypothetical protein